MFYSVLLFLVVFIRLSGARNDYQTDKVGRDALERCAQLLRPLTLDTFIDEYLELQPLFLKRTAGFYGPLLHLDDVDSILEQAFGKVDATGQTMLHGHGDRWRLVRRTDKGSVTLINTTISITDVHEAYRRGFTLVVNGLQRHLPNARALSDLVSGCLGFRTSVNLYLTPPGGRGLSTHLDWMDGLILQLHGSKAWRLFSPKLVVHPRPDLVFSPLDAEGRVVSELRPETVELHEGDLLYIPRGVVHDAASNNKSAPSLHLTVGVEVATHFSLQALLHHVIREHFLRTPPSPLVLEDDQGRLRMAVPPGSVEDLLHALLHCVSSRTALLQTAELRAALGLTEHLARRDRFNLEAQFRRGVKALLKTNLMKALLLAVEQELVAVEDPALYAPAMQPLQSFEKRPTSYVRRFFNKELVALQLSSDAVLSAVARGVVRGCYSSAELARQVRLLNWSSATAPLRQTMTEILVLSSTAWKSFRTDAEYHRDV